MRLLLALFLLAYPASTAAMPPWVAAIGSEQPPAFLINGNDNITHLQAGAKAPYEGILLDLDTASKWTLRADWAQKQLQLDSDLLRSVMQQEIDARERLLLASKESYEREIVGLRTDLREQAKTFEKSQRPTPFYKTGAFGFAMGALIAGVGATAIAVAAK